jgi:hypothetical protein
MTPSSFPDLAAYLQFDRVVKPLLLWMIDVAASSL